GNRVGSNQTEYSESHVRRVRLVRALIETGGLSIAASRNVLIVMDANLESPAYFLEAAQHALDGGSARNQQPGSENSRQRIIALFGPGAKISLDNPGIESAARALDGFLTIGFEPSTEFLEAYLTAASSIAHVDLESLMTQRTPESIAELMVVGTVMGDVLAAGLRRLAHEVEASAVFPTVEPQENEGE
ncbi:MAG: MerR family transcriptional regulator, partial [Terrimesophilobacter sp.]